MTDITLRVSCDRAAAVSFSVALGGGWARVVFCTPPVADWAAHLTPLLGAAKAMLDAVSAFVAVGRTRVFVEGPDAPADPTDLTDLVVRTWLVVTRGEGPPSPDPAQPATPVPAAAAPAPNASRVSWQPPAVAPSTNPVQSGGGARRGGQRPEVDERTVAAMVNTVRTYVGQYGAAPDFRAEKAAAREKVYNYIRSTTARQQAPDALVEAVRRRLADEQ